MIIPGRQRGFVELRCASRVVRVLRELPQAYGDLYENSTRSDNDGGRCKSHGRIAFSARPGIETDQTGAAQ